MSSDLLAEYATIQPTADPHSIEAEQAVLGALMLGSDAWDEIADKITANDFYLKEHILIFQTMSGLVAQSKPIDVITVSEVCPDLAYLASLAKNTPSAANIKAYAGIVRNYSLIRGLIRAGKDIYQMGLDAKGKDAKELVDLAESKVFALAEHHARSRNTIRRIDEVLTEAVNHMQEQRDLQSPITGIATGYKELDLLTGGLQRSDLIIVAARPSVGKSTFATNILEYVAIRGNKPVLFFSMEMPARQIGDRIIASLSRVQLQTVKNGQVGDLECGRIASGVSLIANKKVFIDDSCMLSPMDVRARARRMIKENGEFGLIIIDYLQLMHIPGFKENRAAELAEITRSMKILARELNVPIILLSQLNRNPEQRIERRPVLSDLRESGSIEQDADLVVFIYRDEIYNKESAAKGTAEIIIGKHRNGALGTVNLTFIGRYARFEDPR